MRISGGLARSIAIESLPLKGVRPATDFLRERLFACLGDSICGARVLDLFAGFGGYGLEALSRGALSACFLEREPKALDCIKKTYQALSRSLGHAPPSTFVCRDILHWTPQEHAYDFIFVDPPYEHTAFFLKKLFPLFQKAIAQTPQARLLLELPNAELPEHPGFSPVRHLTRGNNPSMLILGVELRGACAP